MYSHLSASDISLLFGLLLSEPDCDSLDDSLLLEDELEL